MSNMYSPQEALRLEQERRDRAEKIGEFFLKAGEK